MFFLELSCFFHDSVDVGNLISGSPAFSKTTLTTFKIRRGGHEEITLVQGKEQQPRFAGAAVTRLSEAPWEVP